MTINRFTKEQTINFLAEQLPQGNALASKYCEGSNLRRYLSGKSVEFKRFQDTMALFLEQLDPRITSSYIEEWEASLGIPDSCIPLATTDQERRDNIVLKLTSLSVSTEEDYKTLASIFGFTIEFDDAENFTYTFPFNFTDGTSCSSGFPFEFPFILSPTTGEKFIWCIRGNFSSDPEKATIFQCLVRLLTSAPYKVVFVEG
jgi:hypothetical protein